MVLEITVQERDELVHIIEECLTNTKCEVRRTRNPDWKEHLHEEEDLLNSLLTRLRTSGN